MVNVSGLLHLDSCRILYHSEITGQAHSDNGDEESGYLATPFHLTGCEPKQSDKMITADDDTTHISNPDLDRISDFSKTTHDNTCVKPLFRRFLEVTLLFRWKAKKA